MDRAVHDSFEFDLDELLEEIGCVPELANSKMHTLPGSPKGDSLTSKSPAIKTGRGNASKTDRYSQSGAATVAPSTLLSYMGAEELGASTVLVSTGYEPIFGGPDTGRDTAWAAAYAPLDFSPQSDDLSPSMRKGVVAETADEADIPARAVEAATVSDGPGSPEPTGVWRPNDRDH